MDTTEPVQYLTFTIGPEEYALAVLRVREIIRYEAVTRVPRLPRWIRGVINLRGRVVPVVDLGLKLGLPQGDVTPSTCILITDMSMDGEMQIVGLVADSVCQVVDLRADDLEPSPSFGTRIRAEYLVAMGKVEGRFVLILDADRILAPDELEEAASLGAPRVAEVDEGLAGTA